MRLNRRLLLLCAILAVFAIALMPRAALARTGKYVFDEYNLLSQEKFDSLEHTASSYADEYGVGVYLLTTSDMGESDPSPSERNEYARSYYLAHDLGVGPGKDGIIFVLAVDSRDYVTVKHFDDPSKDPFSNDSVDTMEDKVTDHLSDNEWYEGCEAYYSTIGEHLAYFAKNGKQWTEPHVMGSIIKALATLLIPLFIAIGVVSSEKAAMQTAKLRTEASNYVKPGSFNLRVSTDTFLNRTMSVIPIHDEKHDSGGGWSDMGGGFSGSGGGKF